MAAIAPGPYKPAGGIRTSSMRVGAGTMNTRESAITAPTGGATIDAEARTAINAIITVLEEYGMVTPN